MLNHFRAKRTSRETSSIRRRDHGVVDHRDLDLCRRSRKRIHSAAERATHDRGHGLGHATGDSRRTASIHAHPAARPRRKSPLCSAATRCPGSSTAAMSPAASSRSSHGRQQHHGRAYRFRPRQRIHASAQGDLGRRRSSLRFQSLHHPRRQGGKGQVWPRCRCLCPPPRSTKLKREAAEAQAREANQLKAEETKAEQDRSRYPGQLHFDYTWDQKKGNALGTCSRSGEMTSSPTCAAISRKRQPSTNSRTRREASSISISPTASIRFRRPSRCGYLAIGKQKVEFRRVGGGN